MNGARTWADEQRAAKRARKVGAWLLFALAMLGGMSAGLVLRAIFQALPP